MAAPRPHHFLSPLRRLVQGGFALYSLWVGVLLYRFFQWATEHGPYTPRPPAVEAFLPISALVSLKQLLFTRQYDQVHPAGLTIFIAALLLGFFFRKGFCGWICPVGFASELLHGARRLLYAAMRPVVRPLPSRLLPRWLDLPLLAVKYLLLAFFLYLIFWQMDLAAMQDFNRSAYNLTADGRMLLFFLHPSRLALIVLIVLAALSFFSRGFWCRHLCPYGALLGLFALAGPLQINRDPGKCIDCKRCEEKCPAAIPITGKSRLIAPECIGCLECVANCPRKQCLTLAMYGRKPIAPLALPLGLLTLFFGLWLAAVLTGHWQSSVPDDTLRHLYLQFS